MAEIREKYNQEAREALERVVCALGDKREERQEQVQMTQFLRRFLEYADVPGHTALVEAGTGIGKSFAYLTALCEYIQAHKSERVVIATNTLTLMDQLLFKDIPVLQAVYPEITFAAAKGHTNYICLHKFYEAMDALFSDIPEEEKEALEEALKESDGQRSSLPDVSEELWRRIRCESYDCLGQDCIYAAQCYFNRSRWDLKDADIIVTNHALALIDLLNQPVFPEYQHIIFDEAHNLENNAVNSLMVGINQNRIREIYQLSETPGCEEAFAVSDKMRMFMQWRQKLLALAAVFFSSFQDSGRDLEPQEYADGWDLLNHMEALDEDIYKVKKKAEQEIAEGGETSVANFYNDLQKVHDDLLTWLEHRMAKAVYWHENGSCFYAPVDLSAELQKVWEQKNTILVSATLTIGGKFDHIRHQLGLPSGTVYGIRLASPFPYRENALVYQPDEAPSPRWDPVAYTDYVAHTAESILRITEGHMFMLFTSYKMLQEVYEKISRRLEALPLDWLIQGEGRKEKLLEKYRQAKHPVLLGTDSFWEGVDEEMDCLLIAKLPFAVPTTPLEEARSELLEKQGGNPFMMLSVPKCALKLKQGAGRLIRRQDKKGVIVICDPRVRQAGWGRLIRETLPPMPWTGDFARCRQFLKAIIQEKNSRSAE